MIFWNLLAVGSGGFVGAILRYLLSKGVHQWLGHGFPYGTLAVNVIGSFILGICIAFFRQSSSPEGLQLFLTTGMMGALTTFSTFSVETLLLIQEGNFYKAVVNVGLNLLLCLVGSFLGMFLVKSY